jgi:hypothetical protein
MSLNAKQRKIFKNAARKFEFTGYTCYFIANNIL